MKVKCPKCGEEFEVETPKPIPVKPIGRVLRRVLPPAINPRPIYKKDPLGRKLIKKDFKEGVK